MVEDVKVPTTYDEVVQSKDWRKAMEEEIQALHQFQTWELIPTPREITTIRVLLALAASHS